MSRRASVVVVPSTHCNLRCSYCYELPLLADKRRMSEHEIERMFEHLAPYFADNDVTSARIVWHGGEPLLLPPEYFWKAFEIQRRTFAAAGVTTEVLHSTQTNLTVLDDARTELIAKGFTGGVGVSLDLFGSLRLNGAGECKEDLAKKNLETLLARGIPLTGITVLTKANRLRMKGVYSFYRDRNMNFRLLPLTKGDYGTGHWFEIEAKDTLRALCELADLWLYDDTDIQVHPIMSAVHGVLTTLSGGEPIAPFDRRAFESLLVVDRTGDVYAYSDFPSDRSYGNVFRDDMATILASENRETVIRAGEARVEATCRSCPHYGQRCGGIPVIEYTSDFNEVDAEGRLRCTYRGLYDHVLRRFEESNAPSKAIAPAAMEASP